MKMNKLIQKEDMQFIEKYFAAYKTLLFEKINYSEIITIKDSILKTSQEGGKLILVGNGASASLASHAATDFTKQAKICATALNDHNLITALSNDYGYENWVQKALEYYADKKDNIIFISVSGNSPNLKNGLKYACNIGLTTSSLTGSKENNYLRVNSDNSLWVDSKAYNIVECIHSIVLTLIVDLIIGEIEYSVN